MPRVIVESKTAKDEPKPHELSAAALMAEYFNADILIMKRHPNARKADFLINGQIWEHKSPVGNGKRTIQNNLREADGQSELVILDLRRCRMHPAKALSRIRHEISKAHSVKRLLVITKTEKVLVIKYHLC